LFQRPDAQPFSVRRAGECWRRRCGLCGRSFGCRCYQIHDRWQRHQERTRRSSCDYLHPDVIRRDVLYPALDRLAIPRAKRATGFHAFRHAATSLINARTGDMKLAQKLLGHTNLAMTANVYTHTYSESERRATDELERAIFEENFVIVPPVVPSGEQERDSATKVEVGMFVAQ
jgi:hypothetical protein